MKIFLKYSLIILVKYARYGFIDVCILYNNKIFSYKQFFSKMLFIE